MFAADAVFIRPGGFVVGIEEIRAMYASRPLPLVDLAIHSIAVAVEGDIAYETGTNTAVSLLPDGRHATTNGRYLTVWRRIAPGTWRIVADAPMQDPPA